MTGVTGFIGRATFAQLLAAGANVTALLRSRRGMRAVQGSGGQAIVAPMVAGAELVQALAGAEVLVNVAYDMRADAETNLAAFDAVMNAAEAAGIRHIVQLSSVVVYDDWPGGALNEESSVGAQPAYGYRAAKLAMEERLLAGSIPAMILQPTIVWGAGSDLWTERPIRAMRAGGFLLPEPAGTAALVHGDDVAAAVVAAAAIETPRHERILISGDDNPPWESLFAGYRIIAGGGLLRQSASSLRAELPPVRSGPPRPSAKARLSAKLRAVLGRERFDRLLDEVMTRRLAAGPLRPGRSDIDLFTASPRIDIGKAERVLGWKPRIGLDQGLTMLRDACSRRVP